LSIKLRVGLDAGRMRLELREVLRTDPNNADAEKALYIATDQAAKEHHSAAIRTIGIEARNGCDEL
jgi:hypothetical protein